MPTRKIARALLSVSDKTGLADFAKALAKHGVTLVSTGGTAKTLREAGLDVVDVAEITGSPEMMDGRVKTLHPKIHGGLLAMRGKAEHVAAMETHGIPPIDLLVVNLYPFEATVADGADFATAIENIDIGGPAMIRAAAKNHDGVAVVVDPRDYEQVLEELATHEGCTTGSTRRHLAAKAFAHTGAYDGAIATWFAERLDVTAPRKRVFAGTREAKLRYGENPHQWAAFYRTGERRAGVATARQVQGKELSYNNLNDTDAAFELVAEFDPNASAAVAIIKHANPCASPSRRHWPRPIGRRLPATRERLRRHRRAQRDPRRRAAEEIVKIFTEVIIAPDATDAAKDIVAAKENLRLLLTSGLPDPRAEGITFRSLSGGTLVQSRDNRLVDQDALKVVSKRKPSEQELADLIFAFTVAKHVKSNTIVYAKDGATVGIGAGQMSRVDSARIAARKAQDAADALGLSQPLTIGSVAASDAFFPFADGLHVVAERRDCRDPARRVHARRRGDRRRGRGGSRHDLHRHAPLPALAERNKKRRPQEERPPRREASRCPEMLWPSSVPRARPDRPAAAGSETAARPCAAFFGASSETAGGTTMVS
ncbi:MAG: bifunctional purine biosynthesis protein PurH [Methyloceanibacter sp.]|nr:MAG: bifunctional purine biosynthesis protein PurH [Methyloceanibacter sp.]